MDKKYLSAFICGFGAAVLSTIPGLKSFACCLLVPVASIISVRLYKRSVPELNKLATGTGITLGILTGLIAAIIASGFEILFTFISKTNDLVTGLPDAERIINDLNLGDAAKESVQLLHQMASDIKINGFSFLYSVIVTFSNLFTYIIFGLLGGVIGTALINKRSK